MQEQDMYQQLAGAIGAGNSKIVPEIMRKMADEQEMTLIMAASPPATVAELAEKTGIPKDRVEQMVDDLFHKFLFFGCQIATIIV